MDQENPCSHRIFIYFIKCLILFCFIHFCGNADAKLASAWHANNSMKTSLAHVAPASGRPSSVVTVI